MNFSKLLKHNDILLAVAIMTIVGMLLIPMPPVLLDILLVGNLGLAITIMMVTLYTKEPLEYSTFPTVLLLVTLFRLGLNVSATRLILTSGDAGSVIHAFGNFVIGGNYLVGILIFTILVVINFIVITNGSGRVAEVAARFTLDAMPGKQLSIDADLNAGLINEEQARTRRKKIQQEADFHGTMDGASKFVKGDAIAAIVITLVNIIGGLVIGVFQLGYSIPDAMSHFTILTVGEGLVSQMPALIISTATGFLVTRVSNDNSLSDDIQGQMFENPKVIGIVGALLGMLGLVPGMPTFTFLGLAVVLGLASFLLNQNRKKVAFEAEEADKQKQTQEAMDKRKATNNDVMNLLDVETLELEIGYRLVPLLEASQGGDLLDRITQIRRQVALELGFVLPSVRVRDNLQLQPNVYNIKLRGVNMDTGTVWPEMLMAMGPDGQTDHALDGIEAVEPAFGLPVLWIRPELKEQAEMAGYSVISPSAVIATHLTEFIKKHAPEILSRVDVDKLLDNVKQKAEALVDDLIPEQLNTSELLVVLQQLLREKVCIRDMVSILESLSYHCRIKKDIDYLTEQCRLALSRHITKQHAEPESGELLVMTLNPRLEEQLVNALSQDGQLLGLSPVITQQMLDSISQTVQRVLTNEQTQPVLLCHSKVRLAARRMIERLLPQIPVLSYAEIGPSVKIRAVGEVSIQQLGGPDTVASQMGYATAPAMA